MLQQSGWDFYDLGGFNRHGKTLVLPQARADPGQRVAEGRLVSGIPGAHSYRYSPPDLKPIGDERHYREQPHQYRRGASNGFVRPLPLGFDAEMRTDFFTGDFPLPALHEPREDGQRRRLQGS